jgi:hypothetical protein
VGVLDPETAFVGGASINGCTRAGVWREHGPEFVGRARVIPYLRDTGISEVVRSVVCVCACVCGLLMCPSMCVCMCVCVCTHACGNLLHIFRTRRAKGSSHPPKNKNKQSQDKMCLQ